MTKNKYVISETGEFPPQYKVLKLGDNGVYTPVFGPDPDLSDAERKCSEMNSETSKKDNVKDSFTSNAKKDDVGGKTPTDSKKAKVKKKTVSKKTVTKKSSKKKVAKK